MRRPGFANALAAVIAVALIARVVVVLATPHYIPKTDAADFDRLAVSLAGHDHFPPSLWVRGPTAFRPPLFPFALAGVYKVVGVGSAANRWEAARLLEAALGAIAVLLIGLIALRLWGRRAALASAAIAAVYPPLVLVGSSLLSESLFIPLMLAAVLCALISRDSSHRLRWAALTGLLIGVGTLARGNGIVLLLPLGLLVWNVRPRIARRSLTFPLIVVAATAVALVPWTVRNANAFHQFIPVTTETGYATAGTYNALAAHRTQYPALWFPPLVIAGPVIARHPHFNEAQLSDRLNKLAFDYVEAHPTYVAKVFWWTGLRLLNLTGARFERWVAGFEAYPPWLAIASVYSFWAVGLLALVGAATGAARRVPWALWGCPIVIFLSTVLLEGSTRYRSPADPFIVMLATLGLLSAPRAAETMRTQRPFRRLRVPSPAG